MEIDNIEQHHRKKDKKSKKKAHKKTSYRKESRSLSSDMAEMSEEEEEEPTRAIEPPIKGIDYSVSSVKPYDDERFSSDDAQVRRMIYRAARVALAKRDTRLKLRHPICINFTAEQFLPGATKWYHLKEHYYELFVSIFNALAFASGKKIKLTPAEKVAREAQSKSKKKKSTDDDDENDDAELADKSKEPAKTPEVELNNFLVGNDFLDVYFETLVSGNVVSGFRLVIHDYSVAKTPNDLLSLGLRESILEAQAIAEQAKRQLLAINKNTNRTKTKKAAASKEYTISKEFSFSNYTSFDSHFTGLVKRYFGKDAALSVSEDARSNTTCRQFRDTRAYTKYDTVTRNAATADYTLDSHPCNLSRLFSHQQAMFYYVTHAKINEVQCRLESYFNNATGGHIAQASETAHTKLNLANQDYNPAADASRGALLVDIADYSDATPENKFLGFPYESITYALDNTFLSHEFMSRMPLPHRIGTTLYTLKDIVALKEKAGMPLTEVERAAADTEDVALEQIDNFLESLALGDQSISEAGTIFGTQHNNVEYGAVLAYMGLHQTEPELTSDVLISQPHHIDSNTQAQLKLSSVPREVLDKFTANKCNELNARLRLILNNLGPKNRTVVAESTAATIAEQEDTRRKSLSSAMLLMNTKACSEGRDQTMNILDQLGHHNQIDETDANLIQLPYVSMTPAKLINNTTKTTQIQRKASEYIRRRSTGEDEDEDGLPLDPEARIAQLKHLDKEYQAKLASGKVAYYKDTIAKYRPFGNSLYTIRTQLHNTDVEEVFLGRDIFLRLAELNSVAYANLDLAFFDHSTGLLPRNKEMAYLKARRELRDALAVECWHEFFENRSVSLACDGIRSDLLKQKIRYAPPGSAEKVADDSGGCDTYRKIGTELPVHKSRQELRPYGEFRTWVQGLFADQFRIAYNYKIMWILYIGRLHHCRWHPDCNSPKHNIILSGTGMAGKSHMLQAIKKILPTGVGDMVTHITDQAFNVDRNMNDMLLIYEEFQNKFLGYSPGGAGSKNGSDGGGGGGVSAGSDKDTTNFFKARLTSGATTTMSWFENEETGMRDMKISKAHCQGSIMGASNNNFTDADANVMSRFILLSVPKSKAQHEGNRPQDKEKFQFGIDSPQDKAIYEQHKEIHRVYFLVEQMIKSNVLGESVFGVNVDGGRIMRDLILDHIQKRYGLSTGDVRKRDHILELARSMALSYAVWMGLTSPLTRYLQYDPHDETKFIGFNPRVITEGILPFMVVTKDMIFDAITSLSSLWYHDYQDVILEAFATKHCQLQELRQSDFLERTKNDNFFVNYNASIANAAGPTNRRRAALTGSVSLSSSMSNMVTNNNAFGNPYGGGPGANDEKETDYDYIVMRGRSIDAIYELLSISTGDMIVSKNDITKLFTDLSRIPLEGTDGYDIQQVADEVDDFSGAIVTYKRRLVKSSTPKTQSRTIVETGRCPSSGKPFVAISVQFLKHKLAGLFPDELIVDLNRNRRPLMSLTDLEQAEGTGMDLDQPLVESSEHEARVRAIGLITAKDETIIIKGIKDVMENKVLEDDGMDAEDRRILEQAHMNPTTGRVPWLNYIIADPPKPMLITDFYPELKDELAKTDTGDAPILFVDQLKMLELKPRASGRKIIIRNHNTISPSTSVTLSIHKDRKKQLIKRKLADGTEVEELAPGEVLKKARIQEYSKTESWELDQDIDAIFCEEHLRNIAFPGLKSKPDYDSTINYPPCTYMAIMEDKAASDDMDNVLLEYPYVSNLVRIATRKKHAEGLINPASVKHKKLTGALRANYQDAQPLSRRIAPTSRAIVGRCLETERRRRQALVAGWM